MRAGELFIEIGLKGADKVIGSLKDVTGEIGNAVSKSLLLRSAIVGIVYEMQKLGRTTISDAFNFIDYERITGASVKNLERMVFINREFSVSAESTAKALESLYSKLLHPESYAQIGAPFAALGVPFEYQEALKDPTYAVKQLQKLWFADRNIATRAAEIMGLGAFIPALSEGRFTEKNIARAPIVSVEDLRTLDEFKRQLSLLGATLAVEVIPVLADFIKILVDLKDLFLPIIKILFEPLRLLLNETKSTRRQIDEWIDKQVHRGIDLFKNLNEQEKKALDELKTKKSTSLEQKKSYTEEIFKPKLLPPKEEIPTPNLPYEKWPVPPPFMKEGAPSINQSFNFNGDVANPKQVMEAAYNGTQQAILAIRQGYIATQVT